MKIASFKHNGLKRLYTDDKRKGLSPVVIDKLLKMLGFLQDMTSVEELRTLPTWKAHQLTGDRKGTWALHVTANWRLTFKIANGEIIEVDYADYH